MRHVWVHPRDPGRERSRSLSNRIRDGGRNGHLPPPPPHVANAARSPPAARMNIACDTAEHGAKRPYGARSARPSWAGRSSAKERSPLPAGRRKQESPKAPTAKYASRSKISSASLPALGLACSLLVG